MENVSEKTPGSVEGHELRASQQMVVEGGTKDFSYALTEDMCIKAIHMTSAGTLTGGNQL